MTQTASRTTCGPSMQKMLNAFPDARENSNGWWSNSDNPRFDFRENENGSISIHSWSHRTKEEILALGGLSLSDVISPNGYVRAIARDSLDRLELAQAKRIDWKFLDSLGIEDEYSYHGHRYVKVPYYLQDGTQHTKIRVRKAISGDYKQCWDEGTPGEIIPYGLHKLDKARHARYGLIGEGESDAWACWAHGIPYLGVPGATMQKCLNGVDLNDIPVIYILTEPDQFRSMLRKGESFYKNVHNKLREQGYTGELFCINFERATGYKDPSDLHIALWDSKQVEQFTPIIDQARMQAIPANDQIAQDARAAKVSPSREMTYKIAPLPVDNEKVLDYLADNEYGDASLFAEAFAGQVCYDRTEKEWYLWNGHYWRKDTRGQSELLISGELGAIYLRACAYLNPKLAELTHKLPMAIISAIKSEDPETKKIAEAAARIEMLMEALNKRAVALRTAKRNRSVQMFIQSMLSVTSDMWDTDPWILATPNGVIDLKTGECRDGRPEDYIRTISPTQWEGLDVPCPRFERFLQEIFANREDRDELIPFMQRMFGYAITGLVINHVFPILYGEEGRNGKDTLLSVFKFVLGALAGAISNDVFLAQDKGRAAGSATPHLVDLQGKRLVWGSETKQGDKFNISQIKQITGGGDIPARQNYGKQYAFKPSHTLLLMTNYKPHADARDKAFWTRACLIEFGLRFVEKPLAPNERIADPHLADDLKQEASGILAWLVRGCLDWQCNGLDIPRSVQIATDKYRDEEDGLLQFIDACCIVKEDATVGAQRLYSVYVEWCKANSLSYMSGPIFGKDMGKRYPKKREGRGIEYHGIGIIDESAYDPGGKVQSTYKPYTGNEQASEASSEEADNKPVYGVYGFSNKVQQTAQNTTLREEVYGKTIHTIHSDSGDIPSENKPEANRDAFLHPTQPYMNPTRTANSGIYDAQLATLEQKLQAQFEKTGIPFLWTAINGQPRGWEQPNGTHTPAKWVERLRICLYSSNTSLSTDASEVLKSRVNA